MRSIRTVLVAGAVLGLASLLGLAACGQSPKGGDKGSRATGVPTHYAAAIADGLKRYPSAARRTVDLKGVSDEEKQWLVARSAGVIYPSVYEGFGLVPFEAAEAGRPCFFAWQTALTETLPETAATLVPWNAELSADAIADVLEDPRKANALTEAIRAAGSRLRWDKTASEILTVYDKALRRPHRDLTTALDGVMPVWNLMTSDGGAVLDMRAVPYASYRGLTAIIGRRWLRWPLFFLLGSVYRLGYFVRHGRLP